MDAYEFLSNAVTGNGRPKPKPRITPTSSSSSSVPSNDSGNIIHNGVCQYDGVQTLKWGYSITMEGCLGNDPWMISINIVNNEDSLHVRMSTICHATKVYDVSCCKHEQ